MEFLDVSAWFCMEKLTKHSFGTKKFKIDQRFNNKMYDTVSQDEAIVKDVTQVPLNINAKCDIFQLKALELLKV